MTTQSTRLFVAKRPAPPARAARRLWATVDLDAVAANFHAMAARLGPSVRVLAVVKADAYGHGAAAVARRLEAEGAFGFGVGDAGEALELRDAGVARPLLVLGAVVPEEIPDLVSRQVSVSVFSPTLARLLDREARAQGTRVRVHLKMDTGMGRLGRPPAEILSVAETVLSCPGLSLEGTFTHCPENAPELVAGQIRAFRDGLEQLGARGVDPGLRHLAASSVLHHHRAAHFDMVRPGIGLYGVDPGDLARAGASLTPALSVRTRIVFLKDVGPGTSVGYRPGWRSYRSTKIATLPVGYADGLGPPDACAARVLVRGHEAPVVGRISMDYTTVDVGHVPGVREGDTVTLVGRDGDAVLTVEDLARAARTIPYEILTRLSSRRMVREHL